MLVVPYRSWLLPCLFLFTSAATVAQDAYLTNFELGRYIRANVDHPINVRARNTSSTPFTTVRVSWRLNDGPIQSMPAMNIGGGGVTTNTFIPVQHPLPVNAPEGEHVLKLLVIVPDDTDPSNDILTVAFTALSQYAEKVVLLEARTETWCPQCPPSNTVTDLLTEDPRFAVAKFHLSDALNQCSECIPYYAQYGANFTPAGMLELGDYDTYTINANHGQWENAMTQRAMGVSPVGLDIASSLDHDSREITVELTATFTYSVPGPYRVNVYVLEDHVPGPQASAPANYIHHGVMRGMLGGAEGAGSVIPHSPVVGTSYSATFTRTLPAGFKLQDLRLIGVVEHDLGPDGRYAMNAVNNGASGVGIAEDRLSDLVKVHPNPFTDRLIVETTGISGETTLTLWSADGRLVKEQRMNLHGELRVELQLDPEQVTPGTYMLTINNAEGSVTRRMVKAGQ